MHSRLCQSHRGVVNQAGLQGIQYGRDTAASKAPDSKPSSLGGGALVKPGGDLKKTRAIASHDAQKMLSITPECSKSYRIAGDTAGKGYSREGIQQQAKLETSSQAHREEEPL